MTSVQNFGWALLFASNELKADRDVVMAAVRQEGWALRFASNEIQNDREVVNAAGVLQVPMVVSIWDDGYGISVPNEYHTTKGSISEVLKGFQRNDDQKGFEIFVVKGWDYEALDRAYENASRIAREEHVPVIIHVIEMTQPQGHSTSGSHERYKSEERLKWEADFDGLEKFKEWILNYSIELEGKEEILALYTNWNPVLKKFEEKITDDSYTRWYFLNDKKFTYRKDMSKEKDYQSLKKSSLANA